MHLNHQKLILSFGLFFMLPALFLAGCKKDSRNDEPGLTLEFPHEKVTQIFKTEKETVLKERTELENTLNVLVTYAMFVSDPVAYQNGTDTVSFGIKIEDPGVSALCREIAKDFAGKGYMQETIGKVDYIFPITDDDVLLQEVLIKNGLADIDDDYKGSYLGLFTVLKKQAEVEGMSLYSEDENMGWTEEEIEPMEKYAVLATKVYASPNNEGTVVDTLTYGQKVVLRSKVAKQTIEDPETKEVTVVDSEFYKLEGDSPRYVLIDKLWDKKPAVASDARAKVPENPSENYQLDVKNVLQKPELPNGCEVTALTIVLNFNGIDVTKTELSDNYLPKIDDLSADPNEFYLFEPRNGSGFYCYAGALKTCAEKYLTEKGINKTVEDLTGSDVNTLYGCIRDGRPVVVWGTLMWHTPEKNNYGLYKNLHCLVLTGYTDTTVTIADPLYGDAWATIDRDTFETVWTLMGQRALLIY